MTTQPPANTPENNIATTRVAARSLRRAGPAGLVLSAAAMIAGVMGGLAPQPEAVPRRWQLDVSWGPMRVMTVSTSNGPRSFYYISYEAVNSSGRDITFAPTFEMVDGDGQITRAGKDVPQEAVSAAQVKLGGGLIEDPISVIGPMSQGRENAKAGFVVFAANDLTPGELRVYAAGFSGETALVRTPEVRQADGTKAASQLVTLRRTKELRFTDPGDLAGRRDTPLDLAEARWVMR